MAKKKAPPHGGLKLTAQELDQRNMGTARFVLGFHLSNHSTVSLKDCDHRDCDRYKEYMYRVMVEETKNV